MTAPMTLEDAYAVLAGTRPRIKRIPCEQRALTRLRDHIAQLEQEVAQLRGQTSREEP